MDDATAGVNRRLASGIDFTAGARRGVAAPEQRQNAAQ